MYIEARLSVFQYMWHTTRLLRWNYDRKVGNIRMLHAQNKRNAFSRTFRKWTHTHRTTTTTTTTTDVTGEKMLITFCPAWGSNLRPSAQKPKTLPRRYKSRLVTLLHIPPPALDSPSNLNLSNHSLPGHKAHRTRLFTLGARCNRWRNANHLLPRLRVEPATLRTKSQTLYRVAIKAGLYRKYLTLLHWHADILTNTNIDGQTEIKNIRSITQPARHNVC